MIKFFCHAISVNTEITDNNAESPAGWVCYDGQCRLCLAWVGRLRGILGRRRLRLLPLQSPEAKHKLGLADAELLKEMRLLLPSGRSLGGADAMVEISRRIWWMWPLWAVSRCPGVMPVLRVAYRALAANRHCAQGVCSTTHRAKVLDWLPLVVLPSVAIVSRSALPDWVFMWVLAFAIFFGCKWLTLRRSWAGRARPSRFHAFAYLLLWPGMEANPFLSRISLHPPSLQSWVGATAKTVAGAGLLWFVAVASRSLHPLLIGWLGMAGVVLLLHFGLFHLLALFWRTQGRDVKPLMRAPLLATSLADFWGQRWNTAFNTLAHNLVFRTLARRTGVGWATLGVFLISGLIHDLVISVPARGGYGLPTAYFLLQGMAVLFERSRAGRALCLGRGARGWLFTFLVTAAPAFWLFHPDFIHHVILPMLQVIGSIGSLP